MIVQDTLSPEDVVVGPKSGEGTSYSERRVAVISTSCDEIVVKDSLNHEESVANPQSDEGKPFLI